VTRRVPSLPPWLAGLLATYLIAALIAGLQQVGLADWSTADGAALTRVCLVSITIATLAAFLIAFGGIPLGYLLARLPGRTMGLLGFLVQLPLACHHSLDAVLTLRRYPVAETCGSDRERLMDRRKGCGPQKRAAQSIEHAASENGLSLVKTVKEAIIRPVGEVLTGLLPTQE